MGPFYFLTVKFKNNAPFENVRYLLVWGLKTKPNIKVCLL
jgi:hypothetical protein